MRTNLLLLCLALAACNRDEPPAPSADQSARLDEAEDMLNGMEEGATNEKGPEAKTSDPSTNSDV
jgi:hypothetical protein